MRRARYVLGIVLVALAVSAATVEAGAIECDGRAWPWGLECWAPHEGDEFAAWLAAHGSSAQRFEENYPELAATFNEPWPPPPREEYWERCVTGAACARAVISKIFGAGWEYWYGIAGCETGGTYYNRAVGGAGELGWFQIHPVHFGSAHPGKLLDARYNTRAAWRLSSGGTNAGPWTCA